MSADDLLLFYEEPDLDRWVPLDRYPRKFVRRILRRPSTPGGVKRWFLNLCHGLDRLGVNYTINEYRRLKRPTSVAHVIGKAHVLEKLPRGTKVFYGPGVAAHPFDHDGHPTIWGTYDVKGLIIPCKWLAEMYRGEIPARIPINVWPAGIDTELWDRRNSQRPGRAVLFYDKIRWDRSYWCNTLLYPAMEYAKTSGWELNYIRYGRYVEDEYRSALERVDAMVFMCEHETQGFAYLQALSVGVPIFAWDMGGFWRDPSMFPDRVRFLGVTSVPYFDERCGLKFRDLEMFIASWGAFVSAATNGGFDPRAFVTENFDLAGQARKYLKLTNNETST